MIGHRIMAIKAKGSLRIDIDDPRGDVMVTLTTKRGRMAATTLPAAELWNLADQVLKYLPRPQGREGDT